MGLAVRATLPRLSPRPARGSSLTLTLAPARASSAIYIYNIYACNRVERSAAEYEVIVFICGSSRVALAISQLEIAAHGSGWCAGRRQSQQKAWPHLVGVRARARVRVRVGVQG